MRSRLVAAFILLGAQAGLTFAQGLSDQPKPLPAMPGSLIGDGQTAPHAAALDDGPKCDLKKPCGPAGRSWIWGEYLLWWVKNDQAPPLVTTGPASFPVAFLGNPGTEIVNNGTISRGLLSGARVGAGYWLNECQTLGVEVNGFWSGLNSSHPTYSSTTTPVLARPFFNQNTGSEFSEFPAFPGFSTGQISVNSPGNLFGGMAGFRKNCCCGCWYRLDAIGGFDYLHLGESLTIQESGTNSPTAAQLPGVNFVVTDRFATRNDFYGGYMGLFAEARKNKWFVDVRTMVALGDNHQSVTINGAQTLAFPGGGVQNFTGGLLAERSNIGHFTSDRFGVVPEADIWFGRQLTQHVRAFVGYSLLYWNNVARPGGQIDRVIDVTQIPNFGATNPPTANPRPGVLFGQSDFWAQGVNFGFQISW